jgi:hypothetical protein
MTPEASFNARDNILNTTEVRDLLNGSIRLVAAEGASVLRLTTRFIIVILGLWIFLGTTCPLRAGGNSQVS